MTIVTNKSNTIIGINNTILFPDKEIEITNEYAKSEPIKAMEALGMISLHVDDAGNEPEAPQENPTGEKPVDAEPVAKKPRSRAKKEE